MTTKVQEENANPYNQNKSWHKDIEDKQFESSEGMFFQEPTKEPTNENVEQSVEQEAVEESPKDQPYKRPDYKKRYDDLKKHYDAKLNEFKSREQELINEATKNRTEYKAPKSPEELEAFKQEYPDVYEVVETVSHLQASEKSKVLEERLEALQQREKELIRKDAEKRLMDRHPDFEDIRNSDDFHDWAKSQPNSIQNWIYKNADDADLASRALDLFKRDIGLDSAPKKSNSKKTKTSAADMVSTKTTSVEPKQEKIWTTKEISAMSMDEFDKYESEISQAMFEGRVQK
jgi:alkylhydroperoxidase/carboxymuconolactone decarboxylase family protein YurZ